MPPVTHEQLMDIADRAYTVLCHFGFTEGNDGGNPAMLWHEGLGMMFDLSSTDPYKIIDVVGKAMQQRGYDLAKADMRKLIGIKDA